MLGPTLMGKYQNNLNKIGQDKKRKEFRKDVYDGLRLDDHGLQRLNTIQKQDYFEEIMGYDDRVK